MKRYKGKNKAKFAFQMIMRRRSIQKEERYS